MHAGLNPTTPSFRRAEPDLPRDTLTLCCATSLGKTVAVAPAVVIPVVSMSCFPDIAWAKLSGTRTWYLTPAGAQ